MARPSIGVFTGLIAASLVGCLDRGGIDSSGLDGGPAGAGAATGGRSGSGGSPMGGSSGKGGGSATGGATGGKTAGTGGASASGGATASGGISGTAGRKGSGGIPGSGGAGADQGTGGVVGTGGMGTGGAGGKQMCGPVCQIYCPYGNVPDANGCPTCACKPGPICPLIACLVACPNGYVTNPATGCMTCMCLPGGPNACAADDCGASPPEPVTLVCPTPPPVPAGGVAATAPAPIAPPPPAPYVCQRGGDQECRWYQGACYACPAVLCKIACENGFQGGPDGCPICACNPPTPPTTACGAHADRGTCSADGMCLWLEPGCAEPALAAAGCYAKASLGCASDAACGQGHQCLKRVVNPCAGPAGAITCDTCGQVQTICQ